MKFKTIAEAFNHYRTSTLEEIERRAAEIKNIVATDATADVDALMDRDAYVALTGGEA